MRAAPRCLPLLALLGACNWITPGPGPGDDPGPGPGPTPDEPDSTPEEPRVTPQARVLNRWVGYTEDGDCDAFLVRFRDALNERVGREVIAPDGWRSEPVFVGEARPDPGQGAPGAAPAVPRTLTPYCAVFGKLSGADHAAVARLADGGGLDDLASTERAIVSPLALPAEKGAHYAGTLLRETGHADPTCAADRAKGVELVVLDNAATTAQGGLVPEGVSAEAFLDDAAMPSEHGFGLAAVARSLLCGPIEDRHACVASVRSRLALPRRWTEDGVALARDRRGRPTHGEIGTRIDLARAIRAEVARWEADGAATHLVLNLSVGWSPLVADSIGQTWRDNTLDRRKQPGAAAVYDALRDAQCRGVLVVAAVGNTIQATGEDRPLLPAAWAHAPPAGIDPGCPGEPDGPGALDAPPEDPEAPAREVAPPSEREAMDVVPEEVDPERPLAEDIPAAASPPLLYAVGGLTAGATPLSVSRDNSMPVLNAFAVEGTAQVEVSQAAQGPLEAGLAVDPMTGTSVASVVVASRAAAVWANSPSYTAHQVMEVVVGSASGGVEASSVADYWAGAWRRRPVGVTMCSSERLRCCIVPEGEAPPLPSVDPGEPEAALDPIAEERPEERTGPLEPATPGPGLAAGVVLPMPIITGCPDCFVQEPSGAITANGLLYLDLDAAHRNVIVEATLSNGAPLQYLINGGARIPPGPRTFTLNNLGDEVVAAVLIAQTAAFPRQTVTQNLKVVEAQ